MLKTCINGKWVSFANNKVFMNGKWTTIKPTDKVYLNGKWHLVGEEEKPSFVNPALNTIRSNFMATCSFGGENDYGLCQVQTPLPSGDSLENTGLITNNSLKIVNHQSHHSSDNYATFRVEDFKTAESMLVSFWITRTALDTQVGVIALGHDYSSNVDFAGIFLDCLYSGYNNRLRLHICANNIIESNDQTLGIVNQPRHILLHLKPGAYFMAVDGVCKSSTYSGSFIQTSSNAPYGPYVKFGGWGTTATATYEGLMIWKDVNIDFTKFQEIANLLYGDGHGRFPIGWNVKIEPNDYKIRITKTVDGSSTSKLYYWIPRDQFTVTPKFRSTQGIGDNTYLSIPKKTNDQEATGYFIGEDLQQLETSVNILTDAVDGTATYWGALYDPTTGETYTRLDGSHPWVGSTTTICTNTILTRDGVTYVTTPGSGQVPEEVTKPEGGDYLYITGFSNQFTQMNGKFNLIEGTTGDDRIWKHETENLAVGLCTNESTPYWVFYVPPSPIARPVTPSGAYAMLRVDLTQTVHNPYNDDGSSKSWSYMVGPGTLTVLHNRTE